MIRIGIILICLCIARLSVADISLADAVKQPHTVLLMRHALAPGFGDPETFTIGQCATQRNLNNAGRQQARTLGRALRAAGLVTAKVYSSQWCRCLETAAQLMLGPVIEEPGLNSFFQGHAPRTATLQALRARLNTLPLEQPPVVMVTHQVTISALTGLYTDSGGMVAYNLLTQTAEPVKTESP